MPPTSRRSSPPSDGRRGPASVALRAVATLRPVAERQRPSTVPWRPWPLVAASVARYWLARRASIAGSPSSPRRARRASEPSAVAPTSIRERAVDRREAPTRPRLQRLQTGARRHPAGRGRRRRARRGRVPQPGGADAFAAARHGDALVEAAVDELVAERARRARGEPHARPVRSAPPVARDRRDAAASGRAGVGALAVIDDITERRRLEAVRRDFVANISHELKTPGRRAQPAGRDAARPRTTPRSPRRLAERIVDRGRSASAAPSRTCSSSAASRAARRRDREPVPCHLLVAEAVDRIRPGGRAGRHRPRWSASPTRRLVAARRSPPARLGDLQPARQRGEVLRRGLVGRGRGVRPDGRRRGHLAVARPRHRHPEPATSSGSSSASTASTRPAAARPAAPASASPSSATWSTTTTARSRSSLALGEGSTFTLSRPRPPLRCRSAIRPSTPTVPTRRPDASDARDRDRPRDRGAHGPRNVGPGRRGRGLLRRRAHRRLDARGLHGRASPATAPRRSRCSTTCSPTSCCST